MRRNRSQFRLGLVAGVALFGFLGVSSLIDGSIRGRGTKQVTIKKEEAPQKYWFYTGACLALTIVGAFALARTFLPVPASHGRKETDA